MFAQLLPLKTGVNFIRLRRDGQTCELNDDNETEELKLIKNVNFIDCGSVRSVPSSLIACRFFLRSAFCVYVFEQGF